MKIAMGWINQTIEGLLRTDSWKATKYLSPRLVIRATRIRTRGRFRDLDNDTRVVLSIGRPNYLEREFIIRAAYVGKAFPVKRLQFRALPRRRA